MTEQAVDDPFVKLKVPSAFEDGEVVTVKLS
jgi:hypothetical protein